MSVVEDCLELERPYVLASLYSSEGLNAGRPRPGARVRMRVMAATGFKNHASRVGPSWAVGCRPVAPTTQSGCSLSRYERPPSASSCLKKTD
jgi:hypothetical protein